MKIKKILIAFTSITLSFLLLAGCGKTTATTSGGTTSNSSQAATGTAASVKSVDVGYDSSDSYFDWQSQSHTTLDLSKGSQTITKSGIYELTGTLKDGSVIVNVDKSADSGTVYLVLNNANISSSTSAPIYVKDAKKAVLILENGTKNTVYQGNGCVVDSDNEPSAAIFSKADLTITGSGALSATSDFNDGITSKDSLKITDGTLVVKSKNDGMVGKDVLAVKKGSVTINAGKDGMRSTNETDAEMGNVVIADGTFAVTAHNDAIQAYGVLQISGGTFTLSSGGGYSGVIKTNSDSGHGGRDGQDFQTSETSSETNSDSASESQKCLKATGGISISGGTFTLSSYEDSVHSGGDLTVSGGTLTIQAGDDGIHSDANLGISGGTITVQDSSEGIEGKNITASGGEIKVTSSDDGFNVNDNSGLLTIGGGTIYVNAEGDGLDSNGSMKMTAGTVHVDGPTATGNGAIDYNTAFAITGGTIVAASTSGMAQAPDSSSSQPSILMYYSGAQAAGTTITLKDGSGNVAASYTPAKEYASAAISAPGLKTGQTYTLYSGDTKVVSFTLSDKVTYLNESGVTTNQGAGPGGNGGGRMGGSFKGGGRPGESTSSQAAAQ